MNTCAVCQKNPVGEGTFLCSTCRAEERLPNGLGGLGVGLAAPPAHFSGSHGAIHAAGLPPWRIGLGCGGFDDPITFLHHGYPRLALVRALGVPLAPWVINVPVTFDDPSVQVVASQGTDGKITQDTFMESLTSRITIDRVPTNPLNSPSDYAFNWTSGIEATLTVHGTPRYEVTTDFTPISTLSDVFNGNSKWPFGWVLTYQQQLKMQFRNRIQFPAAPVTVISSFRGWQPVTDLLVNMTNRDAVGRLKALGYSIPDSYLDYLR